MTEQTPLPEDLEGLAGEYVLGTLDPFERAEAERLLAAHPAFAEAVRRWEDRLSPLSDATAPETPPDLAWRNIEASLAREMQASVSGSGGAEVIDLTRRLAFWRRTAVAAGALAAGLAGFVVFSGISDRVFNPAADQRYVAVVNRGGELPALIVSVDPAEGVVKVRSLAAEQPQGKSLEVWYVADGTEAPVSLGLVDAKASTTSLHPANRADYAREGSAIAISVEPEGGSPTGLPTGPVVYSGQLVKAE
ncbi:anti-sigma factor domain-containing protein [Roseibium sp.]|uniref:anti-sigma factor n=1 Tax=Roseibium sp. TaxID=1936156 RepID=UPI003A96BCC4